MRQLIFVVIILISLQKYELKTSKSKRLEFLQIYQWSQLEFDYANDHDRNKDISEGVFKPGIPAPIDVDVFYDDTSNKNNQVFITIPRFQDGIPATLGLVLNKKYNDNNVIKPYPSWDWHRNPTECKKNRLISVFRIQIDECQRLWVLDSGQSNDKVICPPQIIAFDLKTNKVVHRYEIPADQYETISTFVTPIVDFRPSKKSCSDTFVYAADCQGNSLVVYDVNHGKSWRLQDSTMKPTTPYGSYNISGDSFNLMDGILGMALSPYINGKDRILFYHAMSSEKENWVHTSDLRNYEKLSSNPNGYSKIFHTYSHGRGTQSAAQAIDSDGIMYFGLMSDITVDCWNINDKYGRPHFSTVAVDKEKFQFASGVKVIRNKLLGKEELWVLTSRFQKVATGNMNTTETNFRILIGPTEEVTWGTQCKKW